MIHVGPMISLSLGVAVFSMGICKFPAEVFVFLFCSITRRLETTLGNIKEDLLVHIHVLVNFSAPKCPVKFPVPF